MATAKNAPKEEGRGPGRLARPRCPSPSEPDAAVAVADARRERSRTTADPVLATYRDPLGGHWQMLAALPLDRVEPTPFQRDLSGDARRPARQAIDKLDRFLDPVIAVPAGDGKYWSPNGYHRLGAMQAARREVHRRARRSRAGGRAPHPAAQHREGAQPARAGARGGRGWPKRWPSSTTARSASSRSSSRRPRS